MTSLRVVIRFRLSVGALPPLSRGKPSAKTGTHPGSSPGPAFPGSCSKLGKAVERRCRGGLRGGRRAVKGVTERSPASFHPFAIGPFHELGRCQDMPGIDEIILAASHDNITGLAQEANHVLDNLR